MPPLPWMPGAGAPFAPPLHATVTIAHRDRRAREQVPLEKLATVPS